ncbi:head-to-tail joining protein [Thalassospira xiamenensis]|uniref:portal protein n=1 Tax=Thalassospira xiamenensis TaxID=220697 RepID=UPI000DED3974|nr:portal protein [Thalassospira xiamenensis]RCK32034.1 head-to-tail joining protein [Thalassospira xiamenensis]
MTERQNRKARPIRPARKTGVAAKRATSDRAATDGAAGNGAETRRGDGLVGAGRVGTGRTGTDKAEARPEDVRQSRANQKAARFGRMAKEPVGRLGAGAGTGSNAGTGAKTGTIAIADLRARFRAAMGQKRGWMRHWQECYEFALPQRNGASEQPVASGGEKKFDRVFDATAPDAVEQLAASLMAEITPPSGGWFTFEPGGNVADADRDILTARLARAASILQGHFDRSNFAVEMHQAFLDLVTAGTACLRLEADDFLSPSAFRFGAVPLRDVAFEERHDGRMDAVFRKFSLTRDEIARQWPEAKLPRDDRDAGDSPKRYAVVEAVLPDPGAFGGYQLCVFFEDGGQVSGGLAGEDGVIHRDRFDVSPYIAFRWMKAPGEVYGRSPVMKALPDIKTANKVVELVLKNASIAVTGIWQADDDGVLNPAAIRLVPGSIIPKAVGSAGLTPLDAPGRFDVSDLVLSDLRDRIRRCLLADRLGQSDQPGMTATEVLERASENARLLGATYGRLQAELLYPLIRRAIHILVRRGELPDMPLDGDVVQLRHSAPLAQLPKRVQAGQAMDWLSRIATLGPEALGEVDMPHMVRWLADQFGVPDHLLRPMMPVLPVEASVEAAMMEDAI